MGRGNDEDAQNYVNRLVNTIQANHTNDYYLFEADANEMKVTISYQVGNNPVQQKEVPLTGAIIRNHYVVITGWIPNQVQPVPNIELNLLVVPWTEISIINVPPFV